MNTACIFCAIEAGEPNAGVVAQDAHTITLLDLGEHRHGYLLIAPRHHYTDIREMDEAAIDAVFLAVKRAVHCIDQEFPGDGMCVWQSTHSPDVPCITHAHFHVHPRHVASIQGECHTHADTHFFATSVPAFIQRLRRHMLDTRVILNKQINAMTPLGESRSTSCDWHPRLSLWCGCNARAVA
ncbi:HIT family protein [Dyella lipolytica]|uniref:HIT family protein n=1 Tax=Dyella lipolytica TaxID=1867835 RepID=A0ABW8IXY2_9GAMM|nr:HIT family protein [Dyella lipolytica]